MNTLRHSLLLAGLTLVSTYTQAQRKCGAAILYAKRAQYNPALVLQRKQAEQRTQAWIAQRTQNKQTGGVVIIPVVVHVIYNTTVENISAAQIQSQIDVLNADYRKLNIDTLPSTHPFASVTADTKVQFCLASTDPNGNATDGITRTYTATTSFTGNGDEKYTSNGGHDNWDATQYLNMWVCNADASGLLGYATFPTDLAINPTEDGVVINVYSFGTIGTAGTNGYSTFADGRTATHEVGHWLNLFHIWGDNTCGDDLVTDTEIAQAANFGCPAFPHNANGSCGQGANGEMYMNYMDYVDDACMNMFTKGQTARIDAALNNERLAILTSTACSGTTALKNNSTKNNLQLYPNPATDKLYITLVDNSTTDINVQITDVSGRIVLQQSTIVTNAINVNNLVAGTYFVKITNGTTVVVKTFNKN